MDLTLQSHSILTSDDMHGGVGDPAHAGVTGVLARVGDPGLLDQEEAGGDVTLLRDLRDPAPGRAVGNRLKISIVLKQNKCTEMLWSDIKAQCCHVSMHKIMKADGINERLNWI